MEHSLTHLAALIRRRAFRSRKPRAAMRLLALADEIATLRYRPAPASAVPLRAAAKRKRRQQCFAYWDGEAMICLAARNGNCCGRPEMPPPADSSHLAGWPDVRRRLP